jgi:hypothetical protein
MTRLPRVPSDQFVAEPLFFHVLKLAAIVTLPISLALFNLYILGTFSDMYNLHDYFRSKAERRTQCSFRSLIPSTWKPIPIVELQLTRDESKITVRYIKSVKIFLHFVVLHSVCVLVVNWMATRLIHRYLAEFPKHCGPAQ